MRKSYKKNKISEGLTGGVYRSDWKKEDLSVSWEITACYLTEHRNTLKSRDTCLGRWSHPPKDLG